MTKTETEEVIAQMRLVYSYDPESGRLTYLRRHGSRKAGDHVGRRCGGGGYMSIQFNGVNHLAHRVAWAMHYGAWPETNIDHIDHVIMNNRISNLRLATRAENAKNRPIYGKNKSGVPGVWWDARYGTWYAQVGGGINRKFLGAFGNLFDAVCARKSAEMELGYHNNHGSPKPKEVPDDAIGS